jgi:hypothetical protein
VLNGSLGVVVRADTELVVDWDGEGERVIDPSPLEDMTLAYAITTHKAQGSQFPRVRRRSDYCTSRHATDVCVVFKRRTIVPRLAVVAFTVIAIILVLIFVRFRFDKRFSKVVYLALDVLIVVLLIALILTCFRFSVL